MVTISGGTRLSSIGLGWTVYDVTQTWFNTLNGVTSIIISLQNNSWKKKIGNVLGLFTEYVTFGRHPDVFVFDMMGHTRCDPDRGKESKGDTYGEERR